MTVTSESSKLAELRAKTDRDLALLISNALEVGLLLADNEPAADRRGVLRQRAAHIYTNTVMLIAQLEDAAERQRLDAKLSRLREALDRRVQVQRAASAV